MNLSISIPPFFIGQIIIAKEDHPFKAFNKGDEFVCLNIRKSNCVCKKYIVDIGMRLPEESSSRCMICHESNKIFGIWFFDAKRFVAKSPLNFQRLTFSKIQEEVLSGVN